VLAMLYVSSSPVSSYLYSFRLLPTSFMFGLCFPTLHVPMLPRFGFPGILVFSNLRSLHHHCVRCPAIAVMFGCLTVYVSSVASPALHTCRVKYPCIVLYHNNIYFLRFIPLKSSLGPYHSSCICPIANPIRVSV
jgi:hypothetical protein